MRNLLCFTLFTTSSFAARFYVDTDAPTGGDGSSWALAFDFLQDALDETAEGDEVWVAAGTYYPDDGAATTPGDRTMTFTLKEGVTVYGGFAGTETAASQRDLESNETLLSGEIWVDQLYWSLHVVTLAGSASLDGVTITKGNANGDEAPFNQGGGVLAGSYAIELNNCTFSGNSASDNGGVIYSTSSSSSVTASDCTFSGNSAYRGGAIYSSASTSYSVTASNCTFSGNSATYGGAIYSSASSSTSSLTASDCTFSGNSASRNGGAIYSYTSSSSHSSSSLTASNCTFSDNSASDNGGAIYSSSSSSYSTSSSVTASDCTFSGNSATYGGAIYSYSTSSFSAFLAASNCTFSDNSASGDGGAIYYYSSSSSLTASNCTFTNNSASGDGGAIRRSSSSFSPPMTASDCTFSGNSASRDGGAIYSSSSSSSSTISYSVVASNCTFSGNSASRYGGAILTSSSFSSLTASNCTFSGNSASLGGAIHSRFYSCLTASNCTFSGNSASLGGAIYSSSSSSSSFSFYATASNCTFWNNSCGTATGKGYALYASGLVKLFNNIIDDDHTLEGTQRIYLTSTASLRNADSSFPSPLDQAKNFIRGGVSSITAEAGAVLSLGDTSVLILSGDPGFVDVANPIGDDGLWGTADDGLRLSEGSQVIEQGLTRYLPQDTTDVDQDGDVDEIIPVDLAGYTRVQGTTVDLGAYETGGDAGPINMITAPASQTILQGQAAVFELVAAGYSLNYQWYVGTLGDVSTPIDGAVWKSFDTGALSASQSYWVRIYNAVTHLDSQTVTASVVPVMITRQPQDTLIVSGESAHLSVAAEGLELSYQWYEGSAGDTSSPVAGAVNENLITPVLIASSQFWVRVSNPYGSVDSAAAIVTVGGDSLSSALFVNTPLLYSTSGDADWFTQSATTHDGASAVQSGAIADSQSSTAETTVDGPGVVTFWWKASTLNSGDRGRFYIDDSYKTYVYGASSSWVLKTYAVTGAGPHTLKWTYSKDSSGAGGDDCIWLDDVTWTPQLITEQPAATTIPLGLTAEFSVTAAGSNLTYQWYEGESGDDSKPIAGATAPDFTTRVLDGNTTYWVKVGTGQAYEASDSASVTVVPDNAQLGEAVGAGIKFYTWGDAAWFVQQDVVQSDASSLQSGAIDHDQSSVLEAVVEGAGDLSFQWKASSELGYDFVRLFIDGLEYEISSGEVDWALVSLAVSGAGDHRIRWEYIKDVSKAAGSDRVWIDSVTWEPSVGVGSYESWVADHQLSGGDALDTATPAGDGVSNLLKYALGLDPDVQAISTDGITPGVPAVLESNDGLKFTFLRNADASDLSYTIQFCDDLSSWEPVLTGVTETVLPDALIRVEVLLPSGGAGFCRLSVTK